MHSQNEAPERIPGPLATLGEGPCWNDGVLHWVDITGRQVHTTGPDGTNSVEVPSMVGFVAIRQGRGLVVGLEDGIYSLDSRGHVDCLAPVEPGVAESRLNDAAVDPKGRLWAGTMHRDGSEVIGSLYMIDETLELVTKLQPVGISNGLAWSPSGDTLYYIDTPTMTVRAFPFDQATGEIGDPREVIRFDAAEGYPDGMDIDDEGNLWVALWDGWGVQCVSPDGRKLRKIDVPAQRVTACAFGGADGGDLYITTAREGLNEEELTRQPDAGGLFRIRPGVTGRPARTFIG